MSTGTLMPFLCPWLWKAGNATSRVTRRSAVNSRCANGLRHRGIRNQSTTSITPVDQDQQETPPLEDLSDNRASHLNPPPDAYSTTPFTDRCSIQLHAGSGGHGCISFLREKYIPNGPANGGDGGTGGNIYIQAVRGETSLHKLARRGIVKASRGRNGQGKSQGGERGEDIVIQVPVGTIVREVWRHDPVTDEEQSGRRSKGYGADMTGEGEGEEGPDNTKKWRRDRWLLFPGGLPQHFTAADFPPLPRPRRSNLSMSQPEAPVYLDLDKPNDAPMLLAAGAMGGLGNPHFVTKSIPRPKFATKGDNGMKLEVQLELKLLADVGLVGLPNAGKSTLLRSISNSRTRVGNWTFTTLQPNIGTVVLDNHRGRPLLIASDTKEPRTNFTVADIPGLIENAHMDKGLGLGFLRHIERAGILAFVVDLSAGDAVTALQGLWNEVGQYELLRDRELNAETERRIEEAKGMTTYSPFHTAISPQLENDDMSNDLVIVNPATTVKLPPLRLPPISSKPWLVVATKADLPETRENFANLQSYLQSVADGSTEHPSGKKNAWRKRLHAIPVSAVRGEGVERIPPIIVDLLDA